MTVYCNAEHCEHNKDGICGKETVVIGSKGTCESIKPIKDTEKNPQKKKSDSSNIFDWNETIQKLTGGEE